MRLLDRASTTMFPRNSNTSLEIIFDSDFDGIMYGIPEESPGCRLKGKVVLKNSKTLSVRYLVFMFLGKISVACGPAMSASRPDYSETQTIYRKQCVFYSSETSGKNIPPGVHEYCFDFDLPGHLPSSFKRVRGKIEYACYAILARPIFHNDLTVKKIVMLNRCLTDSISPLQQLNSVGSMFDDRVSYKINTPVTAYREGGLVTAEITLKTLDPRVVVESIEYGLKEEINYRTTGEHMMSLITSIDENIFPLGKKKILLDRFSPNVPESLKVNFRLCPWVNCDVDSELIYIEHKVALTIVVTESTPVETDGLFDDVEDDDSYPDASSTHYDNPLSNLLSQQINHFPIPPTSDENRSRARDRPTSLFPPHHHHQDDTTSERNNRNRSNRARSLLPPLRHNHSDDFVTQGTGNRHSLSMLSSNFKRFSFSNNVLKRDPEGVGGNTKRVTKSYDIEIPLIVTTKSATRGESQRSRQESRSQEHEEIASIRSYGSVDEPPTYATATMTPPPPSYDHDDDDDDW